MRGVGPRLEVPEPFSKEETMQEMPTSRGRVFRIHGASRREKRWSMIVGA